MNQPAIFVTRLVVDVRERLYVHGPNSDGLEDRAAAIARTQLYLAATQVFLSLPPLDVLIACVAEASESPFQNWYHFSDELGDEGPGFFAHFGEQCGRFELAPPTSDRVVRLTITEDQITSIEIDFRDPSQFAAGMLVKAFLASLPTDDLRSDDPWDIAMRPTYRPNPVSAAVEAPKHVHLTGFLPLGQLQCDLRWVKVVRPDVDCRYISAALVCRDGIEEGSRTRTEQYGDEAGIRPFEIEIADEEPEMIS
ncbi:MAG TPA: hypothetical protein VNG90_01755 [Candidatus Acidoferrum sp.]|nr:hypothetical protein [Candidatus Acidoferrum sp.]